MTYLPTKLLLFKFMFNCKSFALVKILIFFGNYLIPENAFQKVKFISIGKVSDSTKKLRKSPTIKQIQKSIICLLYFTLYLKLPS